jgi:hypothetical protein
MKKLLNIMIVFVLFVPVSFANSASDYYESSYARMSYVNGDVYIQRAEDLGYEEGVVNLALIQGDKIGTREGRTEIHLGDSNYIRMDRNTQIEFVRMPNREDDVTGIHILSGSLFLRVNFISNDKFFEVHSPDASFYIMEEGLYYLSVMQNNQTEIRVFEGRAEAAGEEGSLLVEAEEMVTVSNGRFISGPSYFYASMDSGFYEWNRSRDAFHSRYVGGTRYLPSELNEYEAELDYYGQWRYHNSYGYVWIPSGISLSWRPYLNGRWVWYPIIGWTWVSYEPWGWCVSHYGRWHWSIRFGWYWIPTRRWGPAWVHWYHGPSYIGWCPLSYYGYPGVVINNHYYGNYYHSHYPSASNALVVVRKDHLQARNISSVVLNKARVSKLSDITMTAAQPKVSPAIYKTGAYASEAVKVFSSSGIRSVTKSYSPGHSLSPSRNFRASTMSRSVNVKTNETSFKKAAGAVSSRGSSPGMERSDQSRFSSVSKNSIRTYPSRKTRNAVGSNSGPTSGMSSPGARSSRTVRPTRSSTSILKRNSTVERYPSRMSSSVSSRLRSSRSADSGSRTNTSNLRKRSTPASSSASSTIRRNQSVSRISSRTSRQSSHRSQGISASRSRTSSLTGRVSSRSRAVSPSSRVRSSSSRSRSSSSRVRSSSSRSRGSSSARSSRTQSSSRRSSTSRTRKK